MKEVEEEMPPSTQEEFDNQYVYGYGLWYLSSLKVVRLNESTVKLITPFRNQNNFSIEVFIKETQKKHYIFNEGCPIQQDKEAIFKVTDCGIVRAEFHQMGYVETPSVAGLIEHLCRDGIQDDGTELFIDNVSEPELEYAVNKMVAILVVLQNLPIRFDATPT